MEIRNLIYLIELRYPHYPCYVFLIYMMVRFRQIKKLQQSFKLCCVPAKLIKKIIANLDFPCDDENNCLLVSHKYLSASGINTKCVELYQNDALSRTCYVLAADISEDVVYLSDNLKFNLQNEAFVKLRRNYPLCVASEINVSLVSCSYDLNNETIDELVKNYFKTPKFVKHGDLITINFKKYNPEGCYSSYKLLGLKNVYFKCNKVFCKKSFGLELTKRTCLCLYGETTFKEGSITQSYVAPIFKKVRQVGAIGGNFENCLLPTCPFGLEGYVKDLEKSIKPFFNNRKIQLKPTFLLQGNKGSGKSEILESLALSLGLHKYEIYSGDITSSTYSQTETKLHNFFFKAKLCSPCIISIKNFENFGKNNEGQYDQRIMNTFKVELEFLFTNNSYPIILICLSNSRDIPTELLRAFLQIFDLGTPDDSQRLQILQWILELNNLTCRGNLEDIAQRARGFVFEDLKALVFHAQHKSFHSLALNENHFSYALELLQSKYTEGLGAPKIPKVTWSDVGGLTDVKEEIIKTINLPLKHPYLLTNSGLKRSGILLYGPPGTGKTLLAKAVATECNLCFLSVKGPELLNMYVGQSEKNIREVFERAREASPCIIFFDELDSLAPNRGISGDSGGVMDRVVSQLLAEMDGLNQSSTIFIIGATNRPDLIDQALLRPGRFDKLLYVGPCTDFKSKLSVLKALTRKFNFSTDVSLDEIVSVCPENITGADFYGLAASAWMFAVRRLIDIDSNSNLSSLTHRDVVVTADDFKEAIVTLKPSIRSKEMAYFEKVQKEYN